MFVLDEKGNFLLWFVLVNNLEDIVFILVRYGCDVICWGLGFGGCFQMFLYRVIDENNEFIVCFFICSGCDVNSFR